MRASLLTLHQVPAGYRILYTGVALLVVLGYALGLAERGLKGGLSPAATADWYRGNEEDPDAARLLFAKPASEILDETWERAMADAVPAVVLLALLFRAGSTRPARRSLESAIVALSFLDMAGPALVRYAGAWLAWPVVAAEWGLFACAIGVGGLVARDTWLRRGAGPRFRDRAEAGW